MGEVVNIKERFPEDNHCGKCKSELKRLVNKFKKSEYLLQDIPLHELAKLHQKSDKLFPFIWAAIIFAALLAQIN